MGKIKAKLASSPMLVRVGPFFVFLVLTSLPSVMGEASRYWLYLAKTMVGAGMLWMVWPYVSEMRWKISTEAVIVGVLVFGLWVGLDNLYPKFGKSEPGWNPHKQFGAGTALAWFFIFVRIICGTLIVPPLEEVFYRSFAYRFIVRPDFQTVPVGEFRWSAFLITSIAFGLVHPQQWLAGILCGFAYQSLVCWKKRLGDAMTAHAITNLLLGLWVIWKGAWNFW
jgi:CAAX prenyl protease-like protein